MKREIERRRREGESYNDVLERMFSTDRDLLAGYGRWSDTRADRARETRDAYEEKSIERTRRRSEDAQGFDVEEY